MTVSATNTSSAAYQYLQSLLQTGQAGSSNSSTSASAADGSDPIATLLNAFYPNGSDSSSSSSSTSGTTVAGGPPPMTSAGGPNFSPDAMSSLISTQEQGGSQSLFSQMDTDGDGQVSQKEFENVFGPNADTSKVDSLFNALDSNGDGSVSQGEFSSAVKSSQSAHGGHQAHGHGGGGGGGGGLDDLLSGADATGATTQTVTAPDGSTTTTVSYADGSTITSTTPAPQTASSDSNSQNSNSGNSGTKNAAVNALEQLIKMQSQFISAAGSLGATLATI